MKKKRDSLRTARRKNKEQRADTTAHISDGRDKHGPFKRKVRFSGTNHRMK